MTDVLHTLWMRRSTSTTSSVVENARAHGNRSDSYRRQFIPLDQVYEQQVSSGVLLFDRLQQRAAKKLSRLQAALSEYDHDTFLEQLKVYEQEYELNVMDKLQTANRPHHPSETMPIPRGFYIHGNVGTGKSLLLNNFYNSSFTLAPDKKRRIHFHCFLQDIHQRIHDLNKQLLQKYGRSFHVDTSKQRNPIIHVAEQIADEVTLLCIDEFQVTDIADAMILSQFFGELWKRGVVVVATSNRHPQKLYEGGLNRGYFLPFIELLQKYCLVHHLGDDKLGSEGQDYRRIRSRLDMPDGDNQCGDYFYLTQEGSGQQRTSHEMDQLFRSFQNQHSQTTSNNQPLNLVVKFQRNISISRYHSNVIARFTFDELCRTELGSSDYHAIANHFQIVLIENVPRLTLKYPDRARRFITLVDELYEAGCCLACSAVDIPDRLFVGKSVQTDIFTDSTETSSVMHGIDVAQVIGDPVSEMASVKELSFAFGRAASRLLEMCSNTWWNERIGHLQGQNEGEDI
jgi:protein AFG1